MKLSYLRPSSIVRGAENIVLGATTLVVGSAVLGAGHAVRRTRALGRDISLEFRARQMAAGIKAVQKQQARIRTLDFDARSALFLDQVEIARRAAELLGTQRAPR